MDYQKARAGRAPFLVVLLATVFLTNCKPEQVVTDEDPYAAKIEELISAMTLEEKVGMIHGNSSFTSGGVERLGVPELVMSDGPHGVRHEHGRDWQVDENVLDSGTYLPTGVALASTWNPELGYEFGKVLGSEAKFRGKDIILGPGLNIIRSPLNGRNFEYMTEDPHLNSIMAVGYIKGVQSQEVAACAKHFLANNQETERDRVNVLMDERTLREIYLPGFQAAVTEGEVLSIMGAYNKFRGEYCTHNQYLVNDILKGELGFKGVLMSDWGAVHNTMEALEKGTDLEMGTELGQRVHDYSKFYLGDTVISLVKSGKVAEAVVDEKVRRILRLMFATNMFGEKTPGEYNTKAHQETALKIAEESIVLLKNENVLPLNKNSVRSLAVIGANAMRRQAGGGGSSQVKAFYEITPLQGLQNIAGDRVNIKYSEGYRVKKGGGSDPRLIQEAAKNAASADAAVLVCGWIHGYSDAWNDNAYDAESLDKPDTYLPFGQDELITEVLKVNPNTIIVLIGGGPTDMTPWAEKAKSIIQAWYPGMEGGNALAKIIFGEVNPSGKLPMTFPRKLQDSPDHAIGEYPGENLAVNYKEGIFVGYRYYDSYKVTPQFCFGHGLSYTTFEYRDLLLARQGNTITVKLTVKNAGDQPGKEVVQVYVQDEETSVKRPSKELKAFQKVSLQAGEEKLIELTLEENAFQFFDESTMKWVLEPGKFNILAGSSSRDIRLQGSLEF